MSNSSNSEVAALRLQVRELLEREKRRELRDPGRVAPSYGAETNSSTFCQNSSAPFQGHQAPRGMLDALLHQVGICCSSKLN